MLIDGKDRSATPSMTIRRGCVLDSVCERVLLRGRVVGRNQKIATFALFFIDPKGQATLGTGGSSQGVWLPCVATPSTSSSERIGPSFTKTRTAGLIHDRIKCSKPLHSCHTGTGRQTEHLPRDGGWTMSRHSLPGGNDRVLATRRC